MLYRFFILILVLLNNLHVYAIMPGPIRGPRTGPAFAWNIAIVMPLIIVGWVSLYYYCKVHEYRIFKLPLYFKSLNGSRQQILEANFPYYKKLSQQSKQEFRKRVHHFLMNKKFISKDGIKVTEEMKVLIAATSIQILFGRESYYLSNFDTINIRAKDVTDLNVVRKTKLIEICWETFVAGCASENDGYNPGLKIMAMALSLEYHFSQTNIFNRNAFKIFESMYVAQAEKYIQSGKSKYVNYDDVDRSEYFAVAIEYFFERPEHFYANQPGMYLALSKLLRQDPLGMVRFKEREF